jgi:hypothetical protein
VPLEDPTQQRDATRQRSAASPADATALRPAVVDDATRYRHSEEVAPVGADDHTGQRPGEEAADGTGMAVAPPSTGGALEPGAVVRGRYVLMVLIGSGGMGQVWKAKDSYLESTNDPFPFVAIKMLNASLEADRDGYVALQRETKKAQELAHPNVVTVYLFDTDLPGSGRAFMSMELLEGESLDAVIRRHRNGISRTEALPIIMGMARGLEYAHQRGIVHSDFKPGNVFVTDAGIPKILDFGIARAAEVAGVKRRADTFDAGTLGGITLVYASCDMIERREPHPADDVYALGLVAYELLTGKHPFARASASEARDRRLVPARIRGLRRREWRAIERALAFDRDRRWQDAGEFLHAYQGKSIAAKLLGTLAMILALAAGGFWYQNWKASQPAVPFESLSAAQRAEFVKQMSSADEAFQLLDAPGGGINPTEVANMYCTAYSIHPKNPQAVRGLERLADYLLPKIDATSPGAERREALHNLQRTCDAFYSHYTPLVRAIDRDGG